MELPSPPLRRRFAGHWLIILLLLAGIALRVITWWAYRPALLYTDSLNYLANVDPLNPQYLDPIGYPLFVLRPLLPLGGLGLVSAVQHAVGAGIGIVVYLIAVRLGARRWLAALAAAPVLLDAYQLQIEQNILSDVWLEVLIAVALWLLLARGIPRARRAALVGLVIGLAMMTRMVAITLIIPAAAYLLLAGRAWRLPGGRRTIAARTGALLGCFGLVVAGYATYFHAKAGYWGLNTASGNSLYGRTANVADCSRLGLDPILTQLCPKEPLGRRPGVDYYAHLDSDPSWPGRVPAGETVYDLDRQFALRVIEHQPWDVARSIIVDFAKGFAPVRTQSAGDVPLVLWQFQLLYPVSVTPQQTLDQAAQQTWATSMQYSGMPPTIVPALTAWLRAYQLDGGYTPGPALALCGVLGLLGGFGVGRARRSGLRAACLVTTAMAVTVLGTAAVFEFSWRYQLPGLVLLPLAGVLGLTAMIGPRNRASAAGLWFRRAPSSVQR